MGAPIGNRFWELRSKHGRDRLFSSPVDFWEASTEYFDWCESNPITDTRSFGGKQKVQRPFTIQGLCRYLRCNKDYFEQFEESLKSKTDELSKDFSIIIKDIRDAIFQQKYEHAVIGIFKENIIARDLGLVDKSEQRTISEQPIFSDDKDNE